jgi:hypothetical protein
MREMEEKGNEKNNYQEKIFKQKSPNRLKILYLEQKKLAKKFVKKIG